MVLDQRQQDFDRAGRDALSDWAGTAQEALGVAARVLVTALLAIGLVLTVRAAEAAPPGAPLLDRDALRAGLFFKSGRADAVLEAPTLASDVADLLVVGRPDGYRVEGSRSN